MSGKLGELKAAQEAIDAAPLISKKPAAAKPAKSAKKDDDAATIQVRGFPKAWLALIRKAKIPISAYVKMAVYEKMARDKSA